MKVILAHPTGNEFVRAAACGLLDADLLFQFYTGIATFPGSALDRLGALGPLSELRRRRFDVALEPVTSTWPWLELGRQVASKAGLTNLTRHETGLFSVDAVYQNLDKRVAARLAAATRRGVTGIYAYEDGAAFSFEEAKKLGLKCIYDLPIGYWRSAQRYLKVEQERWPAWSATMPGFLDSAAKLERKDEEMRLADKIIVASQFTASTLRDFPTPLAPVEVIPYGFPPVGEARTYSTPGGQRPLKLLFVGGLSQRKGIADLFAAVEGLEPRVQLTVVGRKASNDCPALDAALAKHEWIPSLPHAEILKLMRAHDVLVFPSLFEGFGLVITEAMSQGTPVITTDRTAGPDLIEHGRNGWLVEAASTPALRASIEELLRQPEKIAEIGKAAMETARLRPWKVYGQEIAAAVGSAL